MNSDESRVDRKRLPKAGVLAAKRRKARKKSKRLNSLRFLRNFSFQPLAFFQTQIR